MAIIFRNLPKGSTIGSSSYVFRHYGNESPVELPDYLCFTSEQAESTVAMAVSGTPTKGQSFEYSTDGSNWSVFTTGTTIITLATVGDKVYFRGDNITVSESGSVYYQFVMSGKIAASGNIMSLLDKTCKSKTISNNYCYSYMFSDCTSLTTSPALPATALSDYCYSSMFRGCTSLQVYSSLGTSHTKVWRIPTSGNASSYTSQTRMFYNCPGSYKTTSSVSLNTTFYTQNTPV